MLNYLVDLNNSKDESHSNNENLDGNSTNQFEEASNWSVIKTKNTLKILVSVSHKEYKL